MQIAKRAESVARLHGYDVVILDTAGRTHIDEPLMDEMAQIRDAARPHEILLVADALTGQDAVNLAKNFNERVGLTGIVLTVGASVSQCADATRIALGRPKPRSISSPSRDRNCFAGASVRGSTGEPWLRNKAGNIAYSPVPAGPSPQAAASASILRSFRFRSCGSRKRLRRRIAAGVTSTSSSSST